MTYYYHGTSSAFGDLKVLKPANQSQQHREKRSKENHLLFVTDNLSSAWRYAHKCVQTFGGQAVVYKVKQRPDFSEIRPHEFVTIIPVKIISQLKE